MRSNWDCVFDGFCALLLEVGRCRSIRRYGIYMFGKLVGHYPYPYRDERKCRRHLVRCGVVIWYVA